MKKVGDWWLADDDTYFPQFAADGFQIDHLHAAFKHINHWRVAVDVGAHTGFWTKEMAARFEVVHAFEPADDSFECLSANLAGCANVTLYHAAAGLKAGFCFLKEDARRPGNTGARFIEPTVGETPMKAIDDLELPHCDFLKIDVEGFEYQVLRGAMQTIRRCQPVISMETDKPFAKVRYGVSDNKAELDLIGLGYKVVEHMRPDKVFVWGAAAPRKSCGVT